MHTVLRVLLCFTRSLCICKLTTLWCLSSDEIEISGGLELENGPRNFRQISAPLLLIFLGAYLSNVITLYLTLLLSNAFTLPFLPHVL